MASSLHVVADLSGTAGVAATGEDYLIPSSILNAVVSGLISRSVLNADYIGADDFHGCLYYRDFAGIDLSRSFVDAVMAEVCRLPDACWTGACHVVSPEEQRALRERSDAFIEQTRLMYGIRSINHIKPGIGEATRVVLRRVPDRVLVRDASAREVAHLVQLAYEKRVPCEETPALAYRAAAIIHGMN